MLKSVFALAALAVAAPVMAQDAPSTLFNGPFIGVQGGWQQDRQSLTVTDSTGVSKASQNKDGFGYGGQIGYDFRLSPTVVLGAEVDLTGRTGTSRIGGTNGYDLKQGRTIAVWDTRVEDEQGRLVCVSRCTVALRPVGAITTS